MDWDRAYPPTPRSYHDALQNVLDHLEEKSMKRRQKAALTLVAALLGALLIGTVALAAINHWGIMDFFHRNNQDIKPLPGSEQLIEKDLGDTENGTLRLIIREAMYDGAGIRVVAVVEPLDPTRFQVVDGSDEETPSNPKLDPVAITGASLTAHNATFDDNFSSLDEFEQQGSTLIYSAEYLIQGEAPESIRMNLSFEGDSKAARLSADFTIQNLAEARVVKLTPKAEGEEFRIISAEIRYTRVAAYLDMTYQDWQPAPADAPFEVPGGTYYGSLKQKFFHKDPNCSGMKNAQAHDLSEYLEHDVRPCPICLGAPRPASTRALDFVLLDETGKEIEWSGCSSGQIGDEIDGVRTYHQTMMLQTTAQLPSKLYLKPLDFMSDVGYKTIECGIG
jgi:hypothetical protein